MARLIAFAVMGAMSLSACTGEESTSSTMRTDKPDALLRVANDRLSVEVMISGDPNTYSGTLQADGSWQVLLNVELNEDYSFVASWYTPGSDGQTLLMEQSGSFRPTVNGGTARPNTVNVSTGSRFDSDCDGVSNLDEANAGTDPSLPSLCDQFPPDTDNDDRASLILTGLDGRNPGSINPEWLLNYRMFRLESRTPGTGDGFLSLLRYENSLSVTDFVDFFAEPLDICEVNDPDAPSSGGNGGGNNPPPRISGGDIVRINDASDRQWFVFPRETDNEGNVSYSTDNGLPGVLPVGATLSIPGDVFPSVAAYPLFEPVPPERLLPDLNATVTANSNYSWIPSQSKTYMVIDILAYDANDNFRDFTVNCSVTDDGAFSMPTAVRNYISSTTDRLEVRYSRVYDRVDLVDDILMRQSVAVAE